MIYLSSYRLGQDAEVLRAAFPDARAGMIFNALDIFGETRLRNWDREAGDLAGLGYVSEELDLRQFFHDHAGLIHRLDAFDLVWAPGGSAFALARAMTAAGFGAALRPALDRGMVYAGYSAGACVAGPDLHGIHLMDDPDDMPEGYEPGIPPTTLGLVPFRIVPHWRSDHPETERAERAVAYLERESLPYRAICDGEAITVKDHRGSVRP